MSVIRLPTVIPVCSTSNSLLPPKPTVNEPVITWLFVKILAEANCANAVESKLSNKLAFVAKDALIAFRT